jgi:hypothetical protein
VSRKNYAKVAAPTTAIVALATRTIRTGSRGALERSSITTKASNSDTDPGSRPIVAAAPRWAVAVAPALNFYSRFRRHRALAGLTPL